MKEYRLIAWPDLAPAQDRIAFRRVLSDMSHRHVSIARMAEASGLRRQVVRDFVDQLATAGLISERELGATSAPDSLFGSLRPLGGWLRRTLEGAAAGR
jgi:anti-sigma factor RsiW